MNKFKFDDWHEYNSEHLNRIFNIFTNNLETIDSNFTSSYDNLYDNFVKFVYENSCQDKIFFDNYLEEEPSSAENIIFKYSHLD